MAPTTPSKTPDVPWRLNGYAVKLNFSFVYMWSYLAGALHVR